MVKAVMRQDCGDGGCGLVARVVLLQEICTVVNVCLCCGGSSMLLLMNRV